ncbi:hypothetical protein JCM21714_2059 [Gracilibacillus boraciitolerans JCM 21714]|uniref:Uncharacterized protein n=1 Tax=Gracilibacillus boraciitolerans JCM 21714 TaxID=1298598 RepID=W4VJT4_9BACI|nr:hypothetical protein [Gracilibacillus boraciitolerans]GAE93029.1 hypothetical protein JCM21714_2059 [Gracilibacillus boraciitolerans JCM 21714]
MSLEHPDITQMNQRGYISQNDPLDDVLPVRIANCFICDETITNENEVDAMEYEGENYCCKECLIEDIQQI